MIHAPEVFYCIAFAVTSKFIWRERGLDRINALDAALAVVRWLVDQIHVR